jgi:hypothetical protein
MNLRDMVRRDAMVRIPRPVKRICAIILSAGLVFAATTSEPKPLGKLVDLGGHRLHVNCTGKGSPTSLWRADWEISPSAGSWCRIGSLVYAHLHL